MRPLLLLLLVHLSAALLCSHPNDCAFANNAPYCYNGTCVQCNPLSTLGLCDCPADQYCVSDPLDEDLGGCRPYEADFLGKQCSSLLKDKGLSLRQGVNDTLFCGLVNYESGVARYVEWEGVCVASRCQVCSISPVPTLPYSICGDGRGCLRDGTIALLPVGIFSWIFTPSNPFYVVQYAMAVFIMTYFTVTLPFVGYIAYKAIGSL